MGVSVTTELICGRLHFEQASEGMLIGALPEVIVVSAGDKPVVDRLRPLMHWIREETDDASPGGVAIATDLASAMFILMLADIWLAIRRSTDCSPYWANARRRKRWSQCCAIYLTNGSSTNSPLGQLLRAPLWSGPSTE